MNKTLLALHNEPVDIYEEQERLKEHLAQIREAGIQSRELENTNASIRSVVLEQQEFSEHEIELSRHHAHAYRTNIEELTVTLLEYIEKREHYGATLPPSHKIIKLLDEVIVAKKRLITDLTERACSLEQNIALLKDFELKASDIHSSSLSTNDIFTSGYDEVKKIREQASILSQDFASQEQYYLELKQRAKDYVQMLKALKDNPNKITLEDLVQALEDVVLHHAKIAEEYSEIFEEFSTSLPKILCDFANATEGNLDATVYSIQAMSAIRTMEVRRRDDRTVKDLSNGSIGKYMEGDLPFINYLNFRGAMSVIDIKYVSEDVEAGKVKDRGVSELISLLKEHDIQMPYKDAFQIRLLLIEHHKVVEVSTKNNKLDYSKNYLNQHKSLSDKALTIGATVSTPLRNPSELKVLIHNILEQYSGDNGYARDAMLELLDNQISRLPKKSPSN